MLKIHDITVRYGDIDHWGKRSPPDVPTMEVELSKHEFGMSMIASHYIGPSPFMNEFILTPMPKLTYDIKKIWHFLKWRITLSVKSKTIVTYTLSIDQHFVDWLIENEMLTLYDQERLKTFLQPA